MPMPMSMAARRLQSIINSKEDSKGNNCRFETGEWLFPETADERVSPPSVLASKIHYVRKMCRAHGGKLSLSLLVDIGLRVVVFQGITTGQ